jgi:hypothetical protein
MYAAMVKRQAAEEITRRKLMLVSALYANTNYDEKEARRNEVLREIEQSFDEAVDVLYGGGPVEEETKGNPFFDAMKLPEVPQLPTGPTEETRGWFTPMPEED